MKRFNLNMRLGQITTYIGGHGLPGVPGEGGAEEERPPDLLRDRVHEGADQPAHRGPVGEDGRGDAVAGAAPRHHHVHGATGHTGSQRQAQAHPVVRVNLDMILQYTKQ